MRSVSLLSRCLLRLWLVFNFVAQSSNAQVEIELPCPQNISQPSLGSNSASGISFSATYETRSVKGKDAKGKPVTLRFCKTVVADLSEIERMGREGTSRPGSSSKISFKKYNEMANSLHSMKKAFLDAYARQCGDQRKKSEQISDEIDVGSGSAFEGAGKYRELLYAEMVEKTYARIDATSTAGVQERQWQRIATPTMQNQRIFCSKIESIRHALFSKDRFFKTWEKLDDFVRRYDIEDDDSSCNNADYRNLVARVRSFEICPECQQRRQDSTLPACILEKGINPVLEKISGQKTSVGSKIEFARAASTMMANLIEVQTPVFREVLKKARADLKALETQLDDLHQAMLKAPKPESRFKSDVLRPPTPDEIIRKMRAHDGRPYDDLIRSREELLERSKEPLAELKKPISNESEAEERINYLIRYSPQIVDTLFKQLEQSATCDVSKRRNLDRLMVSLCESYNSSKSRRGREKWIIDALGMFSAGAYTGGMVFAAHGNVPGAAVSGGVGVVSSVGADVAKGLLESKLYSNRAVASVVFGDTDAAAHYLSLRDQSEKKAWESSITDLVVGAAYFYSAGKVIQTVGKSLAEAQALRFEKGAELLATKEPELAPTLRHIGENITPKQARAIEQAYKAGIKKEAEQVKILETAGFNEQERSALIRSGVASKERPITISSVNSNGDGVGAVIAQQDRTITLQGSTSSKKSLLQSSARLAKKGVRHVEKTLKEYIAELKADPWRRPFIKARNPAQTRNFFKDPNGWVFNPLATAKNASRQVTIPVSMVGYSLLFEIPIKHFENKLKTETLQRTEEAVIVSKDDIAGGNYTWDLAQAGVLSLSEMAKILKDHDETFESWLSGKQTTLPRMTELGKALKLNPSELSQLNRLAKENYFAKLNEYKTSNATGTSEERAKFNEAIVESLKSKIATQKMFSRFGDMQRELLATAYFPVVPISKHNDVDLTERLLKKDDAKMKKIFDLMPQGATLGEALKMVDFELENPNEMMKKYDKTRTELPEQYWHVGERPDLPAFTRKLAVKLAPGGSEIELSDETDRWKLLLNDPRFSQGLQEFESGRVNEVEVLQFVDRATQGFNELYEIIQDRGNSKTFTQEQVQKALSNALLAGVSGDIDARAKKNRWTEAQKKQRALQVVTLWLGFHEKLARRENPNMEAALEKYQTILN